MSTYGSFSLRSPRLLPALLVSAITSLILTFGSPVPAPAALPASDSSQAQRLQTAASYARLPLAFIANNGQVDQRVKYYARNRGQTIFFTPTEVVFTVPTPGHRPRVVRLVPEGLRPGVEIAPLEKQAGKINIFRGSDPSKWLRDIPTYRAVLYREAYSGIDLKFYGTGRHLEYDIIVKPGADPGKVSLCYSGVQSLTVTPAGDLAVRLPDGGEFIQKKPVVYQEINGKRHPREGAYRVSRAGERWVFKVAVSGHDPRYALIIDPVVLNYSTYLGGTGSDEGQHIAVDASGCAYVTGSTGSSDFPTLNAYQGDQGSLDVFVTKLSAGGNALVYSTYLGGNNSDTGYAIAVDANGCAYVTGVTNSANFPTVNAYQTDQGDLDVFVAKLSAGGDDLLYSTYLGGSAIDYGFAIAVEASGCAYVTGYTMSEDFPVLGPYQTFQGTLDAFVTKLRAAGNGLVYSTYLGGSGDDVGRGIAVDVSGCAYVTGATSSDDFPLMNSYQKHQGGQDAFVTKLTAVGNALVYSTYLGGSSGDRGFGIALGSKNCVYVTGDTTSTDFPTVNAYQAALQGSQDAFVTKLDYQGKTLIYSTYLGGSSSEDGHGIAVDGNDCAYVTGGTYSSDFPTVKAYQGFQGIIDAFVTKLSAGGNDLVFSTYLGGNDWDRGNGIALDSKGCAYVTGYAMSDDFPKVNEYQIHQGLTDAFITKLSLPEGNITPINLLLLD